MSARKQVLRLTAENGRRNLMRNQMVRKTQSPVYVDPDIFSVAAFNGGSLAEMNNSAPPSFLVQFIYPHTPTSDVNKLHW